MNNQANEATAQETAGDMLPSSGVDINPLAIPLRESYRNSVNTLMGYFDAQWNSLHSPLRRTRHVSHSTK